MLDFFTEFPEISRSDIRDIKTSIDNAFRTFSRNYGESIENFFDPLLWFLIWIEKLLLNTPWPIIILIIALLCYLGARNWKLPLASALTFTFIGYLGMWEDTMSTIALISVATIICILIGMPLGIWMSRSDRVQKILNPILDVMQTIPIFVYLLPVLMLLGIGKVPGLIAICVYAMPPIIRLTNLGIRLVDKDILEASNAFGANYKQRLLEIQIPLALPNIFAGINQTIMMALGLAVLAVFIGAGGLGEEVYKALKRLKVGWSVEGGLCIVFMAIIFDRLSLAMSHPKESDVLKDNTEMKFRLLPQRLAQNKIAIFFEKMIDIIWVSVAVLGYYFVESLAVLSERLVKIFNKNHALSIGILVRSFRFLLSSLFVIILVLIWDSWIMEIGYFPKDWQFTIRKPIDNAIDTLIVNPYFYGFTKGLKEFIFFYILNPLEIFLIGLPWLFVLGAFFVISFYSAGMIFAIIAVCLLFFTGLSGVWELTMQTLAAIVASVVVCVVIGLPLGILAAYNKTVDNVVRPILDTMQTMPAFVYLIPVLYFFGGNRVTAVIATVIYALPPMVRMTNLGLRELPKQINEVSDSFGSTEIQSLIKVKLPMASPSIMLGVNQAVIMALAMQVITPLIAGEGLGKEVFRAMETADTGRGLIAGIGIVLLAILLDRLTQAWTVNQRKALGL